MFGLRCTLIRAIDRSISYWSSCTSSSFLFFSSIYPVEIDISRLNWVKVPLAGHPHPDHAEWLHFPHSSEIYARKHDSSNRKEEEHEKKKIQTKLN